MVIDIAISLFLAAVIAAIFGACIYIFIKHPEVLVMVIFVAIILIGIVVCPSVAETFTEKEGLITRVAPELFNNYPILIVTVETFDGEVYTYYSEDEIDTEGIVILTLFGEEVLNAE